MAPSHDRLPPLALPPPDETGWPAAWEDVAVHAGGAAVILRSWTAYPTGALFHLEAAVAPGGLLPFPLIARSEETGGILLSIDHSDGARARAVGEGPPFPSGGLTLLATTPSDRSAPSLTRRRVDQLWWLWPLPSSAAVTVRIAWRDVGLDTVAVRDGRMLREAARRSSHRFLPG